MIAIVTDSSAYLTRAEAESLSATIVPMTYSVDGGLMYTETYIDECGDYESVIAKNPTGVRTSQATQPSFQSAFEDLIAAGFDVLCITISSRLSGTYQNARMAAREVNGGRIEVVDSLSTSAGLSLLIGEAHALIESGRSLRQIATVLETMRESVRMYFSVDDMAALRRSGRLGSVRMSVSTILNVKPLLKFENGGIVSCGIARGRQEQLRALSRAVETHRGERYIIASFLADGQAEDVAKRLRTTSESVELRKIGPVLGAHLGKGTVGVAWLEGEPMAVEKMKDL